MGPLHVRPEVEIVDQVRVEARAEATGAGGRRQEVDGGDVEVRPLEAAPNRLRGERHASLTKARGQLVHRLGTRIGGVEVEVPGVDPAVEEERAAERVRVAEPLHDRLLADPSRGHRRRHR